MAVVALTPDAQLRIAPDGTWSEAGAAVAELLGYAPAELLGRRAPELVHPDDREQVVEAMRAGLRVSSSVTLEVRFVRRDGSVLDADARLDVERDDAGRPLRYTVTIRDSSVRRRLEALRARWELLFRATSRGIAVTDPASGLLEAVNPAWAAMHGGVEADFVGTTVAAALTPAAAARLPEVTATLQPGQMIAYESEHVRRDGSRFPVAIELMATLDGVAGEPRWLTWVDDLTERRRAEQAVAQHAAELARSNADLDRFAAVVTHDLQSPLRVIAGSARILERRVSAHLTGEERQLVALIANGARRMSALVDGIRAYSGVRGPEAIDDALALRDVVDEVVAALRDDLEAAGADAGGRRPAGGLRRPCRHHAARPEPAGERAQVPRGGAAGDRVDAERADGGDWVVTVADNGIGIAPEYAEHVFGFGDRLHTDDDIQGTGIGLAVCKTVVERHGGRIWVEAVPAGGSAFRFTLPPARR